MEVQETLHILKFIEFFLKEVPSAQCEQVYRELGCLFKSVSNLDIYGSIFVASSSAYQLFNLFCFSAIDANEAFSSEMQHKLSLQLPLDCVGSELIKRLSTDEKYHLIDKDKNFALANFTFFAMQSFQNRNETFLDVFLSVLSASLSDHGFENPNVSNKNPVIRSMLGHANFSMSISLLFQELNAKRDRFVPICIFLSLLLPHISLKASPFAIFANHEFIEDCFNFSFSNFNEWDLCSPLLSFRSLGQNLPCLFVVVDCLFRIFCSCGDEEFYSFKWLARDKLVFLVQLVKICTFKSIFFNEEVPSQSQRLTFVSWLQHLFGREYVASLNFVHERSFTC
jgi:hypothetical protein